MKIGITYRLFISILSATCAALLCILLIMNWSIKRGFLQYLNALDQYAMKHMSEQLEQKYAEHENWDFLKAASQHWDMNPITEPNLPPPLFSPPPRGLMPPGRPGLRFIILDADRVPLIGNPAIAREANFKSITHKGRVVGYLGILSQKHFPSPPQVEFLKYQKFALILSALGVVLVVSAFSFPLARRLLHPVSIIAAATHDLASGKYDIRVPVSSTDELGQLAHDFNVMALTLEKNEKMRRQWVADISHELRTPLAVLRGEIESFLDGIRHVTPEAIRSLHAEVLQLHRLVEDIYQLAISDIGALTYHKEILNLTALLKDCIETFRVEFARKAITLDSNIAEGQVISVFADRERLHQLFSNLLENSLKYTNRGGNVVISLASCESHAIIDFEDSVPGVPEDTLSRLFERLYRVEESRNRMSGGAGLGLSICRIIVEAHSGTISADKSPMGGVAIRVTIPVAGRFS